MSPEERKNLMNTNPPKISTLFAADAYFNWSWAGCGFGQLSFRLDQKTNEIRCDNECMSRDSVRKILHAYADFIADRTILEDTPEDIPPVNYLEELKAYEEEADTDPI